MKNESRAGNFVISLDFELMWGMFDKVSLDEYGENIKHVHLVIPRLLKLFADYEIHATWTTVGMLMCRSAEEWQEAARAVVLHPEYEKRTLSSYRYGQAAELTQTTSYHFAPALVQKIVETPHQELASHTYSHFYCLETQPDPHEAFAADCQMFNAIAAQWQQPIRSIVFPRNQWTQDALTTCVAHGISVFRGTEDHTFYRARNDAQQNNPFIRALRLLDHYINLSGHHTHQINTEYLIVNVPSSRFLRPYSRRLFFLEPLRKRRIKKAMLDAAKYGRTFHLWWHPHNFGADIEKNIAFLTNILEYYQQLQKKYDMRSLTMYEAATQNDAPNA